MGRYMKVVFTVIAICLIGIMVKLWEPTPAFSGFLSNKGPTLGDVMDLSKLDGIDLKKQRDKVIRNIPLVRVYGSVNCN